MKDFDYPEFGCYLNSLSVDSLFRAYEESGFLYTKKKKIIQPYYNIIRKNWDVAIKAGLIQVFSYGNLSESPKASVTMWLHTTNGWNAQHLFSIGGPVASRAVILCLQTASIINPESSSLQNYFQKKNKFANRMYGSINKSLKLDDYFVYEYSYLELPKEKICTLERNLFSESISEFNIDEVMQFIASQRSQLFVKSEDINLESIELNSLNERYKSVGLFRYRKAYIYRQNDQILGCVLAYRGPLGINFSLLENRCELIIKNTLSLEQRFVVLCSLLVQISHHYNDFEPDYIYILTDIQSQSIIEKIGGRYLRSYTQTIWKRSGYQKYYDHIDSIYKGVMHTYDIRKQR